MYRIMTVCTGNICRSPMGEFLIRNAAQKTGMSIEVDSAGISNEEEGNPIDRRAKKVLDELNINTASHRARKFIPEDFDLHDLILAMDLNHYRSLMRLARTQQDRSKIHLMREFDPIVADQPHENLGIYDPWYGNQQDFYTTFGMIRDAVPGVIEHAQDALANR